MPNSVLGLLVHVCLVIDSTLPKQKPISNNGAAWSAARDAADLMGSTAPGIMMFKVHPDPFQAIFWNHSSDLSARRDRRPTSSYDSLVHWHQATTSGKGDTLRTSEKRPTKETRSPVVQVRAPGMGTFGSNISQTLLRCYQFQHSQASLTSQHCASRPDWNGKFCPSHLTLGIRRAKPLSAQLRITPSVPGHRSYY